MNDMLAPLQSVLGAGPRPRNLGSNGMAEGFQVHRPRKRANAKCARNSRANAQTGTQSERPHAIPGMAGKDRERPFVKYQYRVSAASEHCSQAQS
ncbi:hypothetical protein, partial [Paratractidigestivibacter sp.]|uniref:hypothetical protein n=1 Tax=Paratractidigestivibacter sp. TaxID=2847316 RepID=UPI002ABDCDCE